MTTTATNTRPLREAAHAGRWATTAAIAVPLCVLPSALWRLSHVVGSLVNGPGPCETGAAGESMYQASLSLVSMALALLTLGLVRPWGEVVPRWVPVIGGRRVPVRAATIPATVGATLIAALTVYQLLHQAFDIAGPLEPLPPGCTPPGAEILVFYAPLVAWAPLLFLVTHDYRRRRRQGSAGREDAAT
jgi:hypothetical protein